MAPNWQSTATGIINILAGLVSVLSGLALALVALFTTGFGGFAAIADGELLGGGISAGVGLLIFGGLATLCFVAGAVALWGGIEALQRRSWAWAVAGSIAGFFILFPVGVLSVIFVVMAEPAFEGRGSAKTRFDQVPGQGTSSWEPSAGAAV